MIKRAKYISAVLTALVLSIFMAIPVLASNEVNFVVTPVLPENQKPGVKGYFDLIMAPGQAQELTVEVTNRAREEIVVDVEAVTASTNRNGVINYTTPGDNHESLPYAISELIAVSDSEIKVPANSTALFTVNIQMPKEQFDGYLLGAVHVKKRLSDEELASGQAILNQFSYVTAIKLRETDKSVENDFAVEDVEAKLINGRASIINYIVNPQAVMVKGMNTRVRIFPQGSNSPIMERAMEQTDMAPNSIFPFTLVDDQGYGVKAGDYLSVIDIEHKGQTWSFERKFVINPEEAATINSNAVNLETNQTAMIDEIPLWALIAIVSATVLIVLVILLLLLVIKRMNADKRRR